MHFQSFLPLYPTAPIFPLGSSFNCPIAARLPNSNTFLQPGPLVAPVASTFLQHTWYSLPPSNSSLLTPSSHTATTSAQKKASSSYGSVVARKPENAPILGNAIPCDSSIDTTADTQKSTLYSKPKSPVTTELKKDSDTSSNKHDKLSQTPIRSTDGQATLLRFGNSYLPWADRVSESPSLIVEMPDHKKDTKRPHSSSSSRSPFIKHEEIRKILDTCKADIEAKKKNSLPFREGEIYAYDCNEKYVLITPHLSSFANGFMLKRIKGNEFEFGTQTLCLPLDLNSNNKCSGDLIFKDGQFHINKPFLSFLTGISDTLSVWEKRDMHELGHGISHVKYPVDEEEIASMEEFISKSVSKSLEDFSSKHKNDWEMES